MPPSSLFYDDALVPFAVNGTIAWSGLPNPRLPLLFIGSEAKEECIDEVGAFQPPFYILPLLNRLRSVHPGITPARSDAP